MLKQNEDNETKGEIRKSALLKYSFIFCAVTLFTLGLSLRIYGAWLSSFNVDPDFGIVALMAKHIATGTELPVFFYGQPYMGSLEPIFSGLLVKLMGVSAFPVCLGTALVSFLVLPVVFVWGLNIGGRKAALAALAFCVIGPMNFFFYMCLPRGGYAVTVVSSIFVLWFSFRIVRMEQENRGPGIARYIILGFIGGLGWWTNQLITASLLSAAVLLAVTLKKKIFSWRTVAGLLSFIAGSLPFWIWNIQNNWGTFAFFDSFEGTQPLIALHALILQRLPLLMGINHLPFSKRINSFVIATALVVCALTLVAALNHIRPRRAARTENKASRTALSLILLFFFISIALYCMSSFAVFNTPRYLVPLVPAFAVLLGYVTARITEKFKIIGWIPLVILLAIQPFSIYISYIRAQRDWGAHAEAIGLAHYLREHSEKVVFVPFQYHWLNFALNEEFCFYALHNERYKPYKTKAELADEVAVLGGYGHVRDFLDYSGGTATFNVVTHDFQPPPDGWSEISPETWTTLESAENGQKIHELIGRRDFETHWTARADTKNCVTIVFDQPETVSGLRLFSATHHFPATIRIEGYSGGKWAELMPEYPVTSYFWSGPRPWWRGENYRVEYRFDPQKISKLRILTGAEDRQDKWRITELQIFRPAPTPTPETEAIDELLDLLESKNLQTIYADNWAANTIRKHSATGLLQGLKTITSGKLAIKPGTGVLVRNENAEACRTVFKSRLVEFHEQQTGPWTLFFQGTSAFDNDTHNINGLVWVGFTCLRADNKEWSATWMKTAETLLGNNDLTGARSAVELALSASPDYTPAMLLAARIYEADGEPKKAAELRNSAKKAVTPRIPALIEFESNITFIGFDIEKTSVRPGETFKMNWFWKAPENFEDTMPVAVFVHFTGNPGFFQGDHDLLSTHSTSYQPYPEVFVETVTVRVPDDAPPGRYTVKFGLFRPHRRNMRLKLKSDLPSSWRRAVELPVTIDVLE